LDPLNGCISRGKPPQNLKSKHKDEQKEQNAQMAFQGRQRVSDHRRKRIQPQAPEPPLQNGTGREKQIQKEPQLLPGAHCKHPTLCYFP
jgi:hypothetical protein